MPRPVLVTVATVALGIAVAAVVVRGTPGPIWVGVLNAFLTVAVGWSCVMSALAATFVVRPVRVLTGWLGIAWLLGAFTYLDLPAVVAAMVGGLWIAALAHLALALPDGDLGGVASRVVVVVSYVLAGPMTMIVVALPEGAPAIALAWVTAVAKPVAGAGLVVLLVGRMGSRASVPGTAPTTALVVVAAAASLALATVVAVATPFVTGPVVRSPDPVVDMVVSLALGLVPLGVVGTAARRSLRRASLVDLAARIEAAPPGTLREVLATALDDPGLVLAVRAPGGTWVDEGGGPVTPSAAAVPLLVREGAPVALLDTAAAAGDPRILNGVLAGTRLALANLALQADLSAQLAEVRRSRERIVMAVDGERRRVERALHDGIQVHLVGSLLTLAAARGALGERADPGAVAAIAEADTALRQVLTEVRRVARGVHPAVLEGQGLAAALDGLLEAWPTPVTADVLVDRPLPASTASAAYFVAAESIANAGKYAPGAPTHLSVRVDGDHLVVMVRDSGPGGATVRPGGGLEGLADRCEALGGRFMVVSGPGDGTTVRAELPCAL